MEFEYGSFHFFRDTLIIKAIDYFNLFYECRVFSCSLVLFSDLSRPHGWRTALGLFKIGAALLVKMGAH